MLAGLRERYFAGTVSVLGGLLIWELASRFVIATGSSPAVPPIPGLQTGPYFTNETIFENQHKLDQRMYTRLTTATCHRVSFDPAM